MLDIEENRNTLPGTNLLNYIIRCDREIFQQLIKPIEKHIRRSTDPRGRQSLSARLILLSWRWAKFASIC